MRIDFNDFTGFLDGERIECVTLRNSAGIKACFCNWGARLLQLWTPDARGDRADVALGYPSLDGYRKGHAEMGAFIGRFANRIAHGRFALDGKTYRLDCNDGENHLHGGRGGTMRRVFAVSRPRENEALFRVRLGDGEDGYPGNLELAVSYALTDDDRLRMVATATADRATPVNFCNHAYFNLARDADILDHWLTINADAFTPVDESLIPSGEIRPVAGTPFDFRSPARIGERIGERDEQLRFGQGYDHNFVLNKNGPCNADGETLAARVFAPSSGRRMELWTSEPGLQFYSGNRLGGSPVPGRRPLTHRSGFCLETQHYPDSVNRPEFPKVILRPGEDYSSSTSFFFGTGEFHDDAL
ncbi:MAG: galactose mutarotase [Planctomycetota bacterium]|jgi:aldose 1-epimerase|nr:galactose mutarotase [Planctomycetota bacterium]